MKNDRIKSVTLVYSCDEEYLGENQKKDTPYYQLYSHGTGLIRRASLFKKTDFTQKSISAFNVEEPQNAITDQDYPQMLRLSILNPCKMIPNSIDSCEQHQAFILIL